MKRLSNAIFLTAALFWQGITILMSPWFDRSPPVKEPATVPYEGGLDQPVTIELLVWLVFAAIALGFIVFGGLTVWDSNLFRVWRASH